MSPAKTKTLVRRNHPDLSVSRQCKQLKLSRSSLYYTPVGISAETLELMKKIDEVFTAFLSIAPEVTHALRMPTHIFRRLGQWEESVALSVRSAKAAIDQAVGDVISDHYQHAVDYAV